MKPPAPETAEPLHLLDKAEWWDVARQVAPGLTWDEYSAMWENFQARKAERMLQ